MYSVMFHNAARQFMREFATKFALQHGPMFLSDPHGIRSLAQVAETPLWQEENESCFPYFWCLSGPKRNKVASRPPLRLYGPMSLAQVDDLFEYLNQGFSWSLFPWGEYCGLEMLGFLSHDRSLMTEYRAAVDAEVQASVGERYVAYTRVVSAYDVQERFSQSLRTVAYREDVAGASAWDHLGFATTGALVVANPMLPSCQEALGKQGYDELAAPAKFVERQLALYRVYRREPFLELCRHWYAMWPFFALPGDTPLTVAQDVIMQWFTSDHDFGGPQAALDAVPAAFEAGVGHMDAPLLLAASRSPEQLAEIAGSVSAVSFW